MTPIKPLCLTVALALGLAQVAQAEPLTLDFLPPTIDARDVCVAPPAAAGPRDDEVDGTDEALTDADRIRFLRRDIRNYSAEDPDGFFDFILALLNRQQTLDETFTPEDVLFAHINLMLQSGRQDALLRAALVPALFDRLSALTGEQKVALSRFYGDGIGVAADPGRAQELLKDAAFGGSAPALLEIARLAQEGRLVEGWDAPLDLTVTMAFGGILGTLDRGVCRRAERIAQEYIKGDVVRANPALALAWFRFAADLGGAEAAWRVVEFHLNADAANKDNIEMRRYLEQAVRLGVSVDDASAAALVSSGAINTEELTTLLGFNHSQDGRRTRASVMPYLQLIVNIDGEMPDEDGLYLDYLREIAEMAEAPGRVFDRLAAEVLVRKGRWAGEQEAMALLEEAVRRGDGRGTQRLARMLVRYRDDTAMIARADSLLAEVAARHAMPQALSDLDRLYRCQVNDAPRLDRAEPWAAAYRASGHRTVPITANDLLALAPSRAPETIAKIQSLALEGRTQMLASHVHRVQANPLAADKALRFWATRLNRSDQALEAFAELEFGLATTPAARDIAVEIFRRVHLNNGVTTALDLAIALVEHNGRAPEIVDEIARLLTQAGHRGEGAAIRLLSRLQADDRAEAEVYAEFARSIEDRGDFLAMMFAIPHIPAARSDDYIDRAVSLMNCGTKDAAEIADAYVILQDPALSYHWQNIGLTFEGGHVLSKLRLSNAQMDWYARGAAPDPRAQARAAFDEGDAGALMTLISLTANPDLPSFDAEAAALHILTALQRGDAADLPGIAEVYRKAPEPLRAAVDARADVMTALTDAAEAGDAEAAFAVGVLVQARAQSAAALRTALDWFEAAAAQGHRDAMFEAGRALGFGLGRPADLEGALNWLAQAKAIGHPDAAMLAALLQAKGQE